MPRCSSQGLDAEDDDGYLIGGSFTLEGCEEDYFALHLDGPYNFAYRENKHSMLREGQHWQPDAIHEPEVEIFVLEL